MRARTRYVDDFDGHEFELTHEPVGMNTLKQRVGDKLIVAYLVHDFDPTNPLTDLDSNGTLYTYKEHVITDDNSAPYYLGLTSFGSRSYKPEYDLSADEIRGCVEKKVKQLIADSPELAGWYVKLRMEHDENVIACILDAMEGYYYCELEDSDIAVINEKLPNWDDAAKQAWEELYDEGKIGDYLAVPVYYAHNCHGPGTTRIYTTSLDTANAVWVPGKLEIDNMNFDGCITYADKLKVAEKYAQSCLDEYEKWCNGEVYGCVVTVFELSGDVWEEVDEDSCWGFIGSKYAEEALEEQFFRPAVERCLKEMEVQNA